LLFLDNNEIIEWTMFSKSRMNPQAMQPYGESLTAYFNGDKDAELIVHRDDGYKSPLPVSWFFRGPSEYTPIDTKALEHSKGTVLDVGAGTGVHSLALSEKGHSVTAIDISPHAVDILRQRGIEQVFCTDVFSFQSGRFDTLLMLGHGIGMVESLEGLERFLAKAGSLITSEGQLLLDSLDVRATQDPVHLQYQKERQRKGHYIGEIGMQFEFRGQTGPFCTWLHVDRDTLNEYARRAGWSCEMLVELHTGDYLARLYR
jgi:2-polyprenyl-3-methyl-5-hydroxy-6-metoxy-1,4-benzoquinol methylase